MWYLRTKKFIRINRDIELTVVSGLASLALQIATEQDFKIFKLILFSKAILAVIRLIGSETRLYRPYNASNGEDRKFTLECALVVIFLAIYYYAQIFEPHLMEKSSIDEIERISGLNKNETKFYDSLRAAYTLYL